MWAWDVESKEGYVCIEVEYLEPSELYMHLKQPPEIVILEKKQANGVV